MAGCNAGVEGIAGTSAAMQQSDSVDDQEAAQLAAYALAANKVRDHGRC